MNIKLLIGALALGSVLALSVGAAAAAAPFVQFGITLGDPPPPPQPPPPHLHLHGLPPPPPDDDCVPLKEIFSDLGDSGYSSFRNYVDADDDYFTVDARRHMRRYHLSVDSCTGDILDRKQIYSTY